MASEEIKRKLNEVDAKFFQRGDQELQEFRSLYAKWGDDARAEFRKALYLIADGNEILRKLPTSFLCGKVETSWQICDEDEVAASGSGRLSARLLLRAIDAWDKGGDFAFGSMVFIY